MGNISVYCMRLDYLGNGDYYHEFLAWKRDQGNALMFRDGPKSGRDFGIESGGGSGVSGINSTGEGANAPFGSVLGEGPEDFRMSKDYPKQGVVDATQVIISGPDSKLEPYWSQMVAESAKINKEDIGYGFAGPNSDTYITTLLQSVGLPSVKNNGLNDVTPAPDADMSLSDGHYSAVRGYAELLGNALERGGRDLEHGIIRVLRDIKELGERGLLDLIKGPGRLIRTERGARVLPQQQSPWAPVSKLRAAGNERAPRTRLAGDGPFAPSRRVVPAYLDPRIPTRGREVARGLALPGRLSFGIASALRATRGDLAGDGAAMHAGADGMFDGGETSRGRNGVAPGSPQGSSGFGVLPWSVAPIAKAVSVPGSAGALPRFEAGAFEADGMGKRPLGRARSTVEADMGSEPGFVTEPRTTFDEAISEFFRRQARLPPSGATGFDPRLTPAWAALKLPG